MLSRADVISSRYFQSARETFSVDSWDLHAEYDTNIGARRCYIVARKDILLNNSIMVKAGEKVLMEQSWKYGTFPIFYPMLPVS